MSHLPPVKNVWTIGTILAATTSVVSLLSMLGGGIWFAARISDTTKDIPQLSSVQRANTLSIAVLQNQQHYTDLRYAEIMTQLAVINQKLDKQREDEQRRGK